MNQDINLYSTRPNYTVNLQFLHLFMLIMFAFCIVLGPGRLISLSGEKDMEVSNSPQVEFQGIDEGKGWIVLGLFRYP